MKSISQDILNRALNYESYLKVAHNVITGHDPLQLNYSPESLEKAKRKYEKLIDLNKHYRLDFAQLADLHLTGHSYCFLAITEVWCGDSSQILPILEAFTVIVPGIELRIVFRDKEPELMDAFLTDGYRSIPKIIIVDKESLEVLGTWGPRPKVIQDRIIAEKSKPTYDKKAISELKHKWYDHDNGREMIYEWVQLLNTIKG